METKTKRLCWQCANHSDVIITLSGYVLRDICEGCGYDRDLALLKVKEEDKNVI